MNLLFLASGSGGHVYPCLSLIKKAKLQNKVTYLTIKNGFEEKVITQDINAISINVPNQLKKYLKHPSNFFLLKKELKRIINKINDIDAIISFGGFVTFIGLMLALKLKKPLYIHEQNSVLGDANGMGQFFAKKVFVTFPNTKHLIFKNKQYIVGNPRMDEVSKKEYLRTKNYKILFFAGSLSSSSLNKIIKEVLTKYVKSDVELFIITGTKDYETFKKYSNKNINIIAYENNMIGLMQKMDLIVMRAGATSISEVIALNKVAILIPSPNVKHNHQYLNAKYLKDQNAAFLLKEKDLTSDKLISLIEIIKNDYNLEIITRLNLRKLKKNNVSDNILKEIKND